MAGHRRHRGRKSTHRRGHHKKKRGRRDADWSSSGVGRSVSRALRSPRKSRKAVHVKPYHVPGYTRKAPKAKHHRKKSSRRRDVPAPVLTMLDRSRRRRDVPAPVLTMLDRSRRRRGGHKRKSSHRRSRRR